MSDWKKLGIDVAVGGGVGAIDQLVQNLDEKRGIKMAAETPTLLDKNGKLPMLKQYGTYLNYGVPLAAVIGVATNFIKGDMATRLVTAGAQLAGRKVTHQMSTRATSGAPSRAYSEWQRQAASQAAAQAAERAAAAAGSRYDVQNPTEILV
jgi:hypothetical protein